MFEKDYPYEDYNVIPQEAMEHLHKCRDKNNGILEVVDDMVFANLDWDNIRIIIYEKGSFISGMYATNELKLYGTFINKDETPIWSCDNSTQETGINHAIVVDGFGIDNSTGEKYLWVRNSWGDDWGYKGHFKVSFEKSCGINDKYDIGLLETKSGIPYYDNDSLSLSSEEILNKRFVNMSHSKLMSSTQYIKRVKNEFKI